MTNYFKILIALICALLLTACETNSTTNTVMTRINNDTIEWKYEHDETWTQLLDLNMIEINNDLIITENTNSITVAYQGNEYTIPRNNENRIKEITTTSTGLLISYEDLTTKIIPVSNETHIIEGVPGKGIKSLYINELSELIITYTDNEIINLGNVKGLQGEDGLQGDKGLKGSTGSKGGNGMSAYELYKHYHPNYTKAEELWLDDLINSKLSTTSSYDILVVDDVEVGLNLNKKLKLQNNLLVPNLLLNQNSFINLNGYTITGDIIIETDTFADISIVNGTIEGNLIINSDVSIQLDNVVYSDLVIYADEVSINGRFQTVTINALNVLSLEPFTIIDHLLVYTDNRVNILKPSTAVIGFINDLFLVNLNPGDTQDRPSISGMYTYQKGEFIPLEIEVVTPNNESVDEIWINDTWIEPYNYNYYEGVLVIDPTCLDVFSDHLSITIIFNEGLISLTLEVPIDQNSLKINDYLFGFENELITVEGIITKIVNHQLFFIEDNMGVISVYSDTSNLVVGDAVYITGTKTIYQTLHQINPVTSIDYSLNSILTSNSINYNETLELNQGYRYDFNGLFLTDVMEDMYGNVHFSLVDHDNETTYKGYYDSRLANSHEAKAHLLSLNHNYVDGLNIIVSQNNEGYIFFYTSLEELYINHN